MNIELFKAILAMDAYNRSYDEGIKLTDKQIGNAQIIIDSESLGVISGTQQRLDQYTGFYALAYNYNNSTIISYRGTDENFVSPWGTNGSDLVNGYDVGAGNPTEPQAYLAMKFYNAVAAVQGVGPA